MTATFSLAEYLQAHGERVNTALDRYLPPEDTYPPVLHQAMRYSIFAGGKRLRPILAWAAFDASGGEGDAIEPVAASLELIHTYSLIHDDLPAMDNDDLRRGKPTSHRVYGEAVAILAGDGLLTMAFGLLAHEAPRVMPTERAVQAARELARASGSLGLIAGQVLDMASEGVEADIPIVEYIHIHKTGALIRASVRMGGMAAGAGEDIMAALTRYGEHVGLAFQIADDLLNLEGRPEELGKAVGSDRRQGKLTYPGVVGRREARARARELVEQAVACLEGMDQRADPLREIARYVVDRRV